MSTFYTIVFAVGILYTLISLLINGVAGATHLGGHIGHAGHFHAHPGGIGHGHGQVHGQLHQGANINGHGATTDLQHGGSVSGHGQNISFGNAFLSWLGVLINPLVGVSFLTVFGGLGLLGEDFFKFPEGITFAGAFLIAGTCSYLLYKYIALPLFRSENSTDVTQEDLIYTKAEVDTPILENGFGKIRYTVNDIRYTAPAKHYKGRAVPMGHEVIIYKIENHVFYVMEYSDLEGITPYEQ